MAVSWNTQNYENYIIPDKVCSKTNQNCTIENSKYYIKALLWPEYSTNE